MISTFGGRRLLACLGLAAVSRAGLAQTLSPSPPAVCIAPAALQKSVVADSDAITGVVVRFTANATGHATDAHLAKALSTLTAERLQAVVDAPVRSRFDVSTRRNDDNAVADGRVLGVRWVVAGRAERFGDSVRVSWNVLDSRTGLIRGTGLARASLVQVGALSTSLSLAIGRRIGADTTMAAIAKTAPDARSVPAFEQYLAGLYDFDSFNPATLRRAAVALQRAVQTEPTLQAAWTTLAETLARLAEFGEGGSARGRSERSRDALTAAGRALALAPRDVRTLVVIAHLRLLRDEPDSAARAIDALRAVAPASEDLSWLRTELALVRGDSRAVAEALELNAPRARRSVRALFLRAEWDRRRGNPAGACQSLNRLLVLEPEWAPAYVHRALVRTALGDRRGGWQDAEMATRFGQPTWGNMVRALIDFSVSDSLRTRTLLRQLAPVSTGTVLPWLDVLLQSAVWRATGQSDRARNVLSVAPCDDPRRRRLEGDPLLGDLKVSTDVCRVSVGLAHPTGDLAK